MFDRVRIKENAKTALRRRYWAVIIVAAIVGILGGSLAGSHTGSVNLNLNQYFDNDSSADVDYDDDYDYDYDNGYGNPWEQPEDQWGQQGGTVWDDAIGGENLSWNEIWQNFKAEWNTILEDFSRELGFDLKTGMSIFIGILIALAIIAFIGALLYTIFLSNVLSVSGQGWMLRHLRGEDVGVGEITAAFRIYKPSMVTMLVRDVYVWLWSLLLVFPGVVAHYAYILAPYIIYENPNLTANQAIKMSRIMTKGYKFDLFVLNLSFIGWDILAGLSGGLVGIFWTNPYKGLAFAGAYDDLKTKAIQMGKLNWSDFGQLPPPTADPFGNVWGNPATQTVWDNPETPAEPAPEVWHNPTDIRY